jgi:class 3 adenylate cyclase/tetratricopeptide (TPR) repeat protein
VATCPNCTTENLPSGRFCEGCGSPLARRCPGCGAAPSPTARFCPECGQPLDVANGFGSGHALESRLDRGAGAASTVPVSERRLITVLFADLVGFTTLSQSRDPEDVRALLSAYFETCSSLVERYGGTVEKFIGDAVMAVWGAPITQEDDAERAVRSALDLVDSVAALGAEIGEPGLAARAGVLTGEAAVTLGAKDQGMVAGDLVNTASRVQSVAEPGTVLVGEATRRATDAAVAYEDAGSRELKGKSEPVQLFRALRVVAGVGGLMKSEGLEPPFVGRARELKVVKELFHASTEARRAQLVQVTGIAGVGKSRLVWEFFKYMDGLRSTYLWHRGRCLAYGEGVTYWALSEMVRGRAGILEGEDRASAVAKLHAAVEEYVGDPEDRRFVEPRLAQLIGLEDRPSSDREELFSAWRLFFEHLAQDVPVIMVFEDMQWADASLLEFIGYLLERSKNQPFFVMGLARPDTAAAALGSTQRNATFIHLEPLEPAEMREMLAGFVPGLPGHLAARILERAEGVPLYAVETVRMLLDRGLLVREGAVYRPTGSIDSLEIPETLHALIAARLDGLPDDERRLVQVASVLGKSFTKRGLAALSGPVDGTLDDELGRLVAKEVLTVHSDPRSPERGQYGFVQDLMRAVAYETLSRHDRRRLHLQAAAYLEEGRGDDEDELAEVIAAHLLDAWRLDESADDGPAVRDRAKGMLLRAGNRAASLGAPAEAEGYFDVAASLSSSPLEHAELTERAGQMAELGGRLQDASTAFEHAIAAFREIGQERDAARCEARLAGIEYQRGQLEDAIRRMTAVREAMSGWSPDASLATVDAQLGRFLALANREREAVPVLEEALELAEHLGLREVYAEALNSRGVTLVYRGRTDEAFTVLRRSLDVALEEDLSAAAMRAYNNLRAALVIADRFEEALELSIESLELARRVGARSWELRTTAMIAHMQTALGRWDEAMASDALLDPLPTEDTSSRNQENLAWERLAVVSALLGRGEIAEVRRRLESTPDKELAQQQEVAAFYLLCRAELLLAERKLDDALETAERVIQMRRELTLTHMTVKRALVLATESALALGDAAKAEELVRIVEGAMPGQVTPWLRAHAARLAARVEHLAASAADLGGAYEVAEDGFRRLGTTFDLGTTLLDHAEWLLASGAVEDAERRLADAETIFEALGANLWIERVRSVRGSMPSPAYAGGTGAKPSA